MSNKKNSDNKSNKKQNTKNMKINEWPRHGIQALWAFITNSHVTGFVTGKIYTGKLKNACVPGLNCYSCPGAVGACPIGSLQAVIGSWNFKMAYYVVGFLIFIGAMVGRLICGFLCPFGLIQDLLNKIPFPKKIRTFKGDKLLRKLKYVIFAVFVILLPLFLVDIMGQGAPYFCKLICPAGTLEGGLPLVLLNKSMRSALGWLYIWKNVILIITIILSILIYRPFCKYICPLGALYSIFNPVSLYKYRVDKDKCIKCGKCAKACQMIVDPVENSNSPECIRCGRCKKARSDCNPVWNQKKTTIMKKKIKYGIVFITIRSLVCESDCTSLAQPATPAFLYQHTQNPHPTRLV